MFKITEFVSASSIWPTAEDFKDFGPKPGLLRGYNIEVTTEKGITDWMSATFTELEPEDEFNQEWRVESRKDWGFTPTGRICFRGYYKEEHDWEEREEYVVPVVVNG